MIGIWIQTLHKNIMIIKIHFNNRFNISKHFYNFMILYNLFFIINLFFNSLNVEILSNKELILNIKIVI